ncbi:flagellar hook-basal body complex protein [Alkalicoccus urumqiensis]|uniref:Flagellar hook protein FlgE n=1 Tax=Alkalicoccus urumqiensis TaxID=1548213 RepID=A0A2P6MG17_ALKUR|nr:flagellar hook-basal body complex protein [Alkalicoccus urumqiensis]PRO65224.1 flagellar basal body rod protein FlgG [Alkalicoccus urumqiensis]
MLRSLYSGIGGMSNFQSKLDVIGNNISNVNTHGFKKGRSTFNDLVSQQMQGAGAAQADGRGGTNPQQIGLGSGRSTIDTLDTQGSLQSTGRDLDMAISGDGYFVVQEGADDGPIRFTRAGNFYLDANGRLVNGDGMSVMGYQPGEDGDDFGQMYIPAGASIDDLQGADPDGRWDAGDFGGIPGDADEEATLQSFNVAQSGEINGVFSNGETYVLGLVGMANFANPGGLNKVGGNTFEQSANSGLPQYGLAGEEGRGDLIGSTLEMSNVDLSEEFAEMIVAQRAFQANTRMITTSDEILQELNQLKR